MMRYLLIGVVILLNSGCMPILSNQAETPALRGVVLNGIDGKPIAGVQVELFGHRPTSDKDQVSITDITNQQGHFVLVEQNRRRVELAMPGSYLMRFTLSAYDAKTDRSAYTMIKMTSRTRAGESDSYAVLLLLPDNPQPLPSACPDRNETAYALHAAERLQQWQEQPWFRQQVLNDTTTIRQFADGLYSMLNHVPDSPACFQQPEIAERLDQARQNVREFIKHQPSYRHAQRSES